MGSSSNIETVPKSRYASCHDSIGGDCGGFNLEIVVFGGLGWGCGKVGGEIIKKLDKI